MDSSHNRVTRKVLPNVYLYRFALRSDAHATVQRAFETEQELDRSVDPTHALTTARGLVKYYSQIDADPVEAAEAEALAAYLLRWEPQDHRAEVLVQLSELEGQRVQLVQKIKRLRTELDEWA